MKPAAVVCVLLIALQLKQTGSAMNSSLDGESGELCTLLEKLVQVKDKAMTGEMKVLLEALFKAFSQCKEDLLTKPKTDMDLTKAPTSTTASPMAMPSAVTDLTKAPTSTTASPMAMPSAVTDLTKAPTSTTASPMAMPSAVTDLTKAPTFTTASPMAMPSAVTDLTKAPTSTTASPTPTPTPPEETPLTTAMDVDTAKTATSTTAATSTLPPSDEHLAKTPTSPTVTSTPAAAASRFPPPDAKRRKQDLQRLPESVSTPESASPNDSRGKEEVQGSPKSDKKFLWIILGILGALMLATILVLKSKVLICTRIHTYADVADYMEEKMYRKNDDIVLLGVTPGTEGEDDCYFSPKGSPGYEEISPRSTY